MKLGIVGSGMIVTELLPHLATFDQLRLQALCGTTRSQSRITSLCKEYSIPLGTADYQMFLSSDIDTVYLGIPNSLHYAFAYQALMANKHVIIEKPMASTASEANTLATLARKKELFLFEAISTKYLPNYQKIKEWIPLLGEIKLVTTNFCSRSSRYDAFLNGSIAPVFNPSMSGGALMDLNVYNLHYVTGLFGAPSCLSYHPNMDRGIDTSGILTLSYPSFQAVCIASKDSSSPPRYAIQGTNGTITQDTPANSCGKVTLCQKGNTTVTYDENHCVHRMVPEFRTMIQAIEENAYELCQTRLDESLLVSQLLTKARKDAGILFPADSTPILLP